GERGPRAGDDDGFSHEGSPQLMAATAMISTRYFGEASRASTVARAGVLAGSTQASQAAFMSPYIPMLATYTVAERIFDLWLPTAASVSSIFLRICWVWPFASADGSAATMPARYTVSPWTT